MTSERPSGPTIDLRNLEEAVVRSTTRICGGAKGQQDIGTDLSVCTDDFALETPAFGMVGVGKTEVAAQVGVFFSVFPDYHVELDGFAYGDTIAAWGRASISFLGELIGIVPTQKTANLEVNCLFEIENGSLKRERFIFDRADLCEQLEVPSAALAEARALAQSLAGGRADSRKLASA